MKKEYRDWLKQFKDVHNLKSINEAIYKLIDIHKTQHKKLFGEDKK